MVLRSTQPPTEPVPPDYCSTTGCLRDIWPKTHSNSSFPDEYRDRCFECAFWCELRDQLDDPEYRKIHLVTYDDEGVDIHCYTVGDPIIDWAKPPSGLGYGGRWWHIEWFDEAGEHLVLHTNNLWARGKVPPLFASEYHDLCNVIVKRAATREEISSIKEDHHR